MVVVHSNRTWAGTRTVSVAADPVHRGDNHLHRWAGNLTATAGDRRSSSGTHAIPADGEHMSGLWLSFDLDSSVSKELLLQVQELSLRSGTTCRMHLRDYALWGLPSFLSGIDHCPNAKSGKKRSA